jgi:formylglycine-generating enzyme required for sulfatase activity
MKRAAVILLALCAAGLQAMCMPAAVLAQDTGLTAAAAATLKGLSEDFLRSPCLNRPFLVPMRVTIAEMTPSGRFPERKARRITNAVAAALARDAGRLLVFTVVERRNRLELDEIRKSLGDKGPAASGHTIDWFVRIEEASGERGEALVNVTALTAGTGDWCPAPERTFPPGNIPEDFDDPTGFFEQAAKTLRDPQIRRVAVMEPDVDRSFGNGATVRATVRQWQNELASAIRKLLVDRSFSSLDPDRSIPSVEVHGNGTPPADAWHVRLRLERSHRGIEAYFDAGSPGSPRSVFYSGLFSLDHLPPEPVPPPRPIPGPIFGPAPGPTPGPPPPPLTDCSGPVAAFLGSQCHDPLSAEQEHGLKPRNSFRECADCPEMVVLPSGRFTMGTPPDKDKDIRDTDETAHEVSIDKMFAAGRQHVTVGQFAAFVRETGYAASSKCWTYEGAKSESRDGRSWNQPGLPQGPSHPVVCVSWGDAKAYTDWLASKTHKPYRLLTEAEWEYAARGRTSPGVYPRFWFGDADDKEICAYGNFLDRRAQDGITWGADRPSQFLTCDDGSAYTSPVGRYSKPNAFGLDDMAGNAWQWTADCYDANYIIVPAGSCSKGHVARGGGWRSFYKYGRAAQRYERFEAYNYVGFRVARTIGP